IREGVRAGNAAPIAAKLNEMKMLYPPEFKDALFLTNHDQIRLATQLDNNQARLKNAAAILLTLPGTPFMYYGEEIGMQNGPGSNDEWKRTPFPWDESANAGFTTKQSWHPFAPGKETQNVAILTRQRNSLLSHYRDLIRLRKQSAALHKGEMQLLSDPGSSSATLAFLRINGKERVFVAHNLSPSFVVAGPYTIQATAMEQLFASDGPGNPVIAAGQWQVPLPPHASGVWRVR
ncbi:MAG TPA: alpha-amylase family glycosyl hydrolase, partial [Acidobacteriota bacterium]|nr:alpha-amylase family glycosyl hydrolase [Acidobacteriota bacterium]